MWLLSTPAHCLFFRTRTATAPALRHYENVLLKCLLFLKKKFFFQFFGGSDHLNSTFRCAETVRVRSFLRILWGVWTTTTTTVVVRTLLWCGNSLVHTTFTPTYLLPSIFQQMLNRDIKTLQK